ncbi:unnamed protein product [Trifolium pratense]|uniref:Uncharacterized protein n=1 Tax=Trifolium pratense TaxID=57577 RepID=A0ACB0IXD9_TRIPR|nr:unnamed protein product [Trifolium pratense]
MEIEEKNDEIVMSTKADTVTINSSRMKTSTQVEKSPVYVQNNSIKSNFKECLKNHASSIGGYAIDGCCEFLPASEEGSIEFYKCAACSCHRNFHRKETVVVPEDVTPLLFNNPCQLSPSTPFKAYYYTSNGNHHVTGASRGTGTTLALPSSDGAHISRGGAEENVHVHHDLEHIQGCGEGSSNSKKRFRTKFTTKQKEMMLDFAITLGWKIQKKDGNIVEEFCKQIGVQRHVFNIWIHNNKHTLGKMP